MKIVPLDSMSSRLYHRYRIPKIRENKIVGFRLIEEPAHPLKIKQREILKELQKITLNGAHFKGMSPIDNAKVHKNQTVVIKIDIENFFPSVTFTNTRDVFEWSLFDNRPAPGVIIDYMKHCFVWDNQRCRLPTGAPTSPILSEFAMMHIDINLRKIAESNGMNYSRYVDDLTFSGPYRPKALLARIIPRLYPYRINWDKFESLHGGYQRQKVTGVVVNDSLSVPKEKRKLLRSKLDHMARDSKTPDDILKGELAYVKSVNPGQYYILMEHYEKRIAYYQTNQPS